MSQYSGEPASMRRAVSKTRPSAHSTGYGAQTNASVSASPNAATAAIAGPTNDGMDRSGVPEAARLYTIDDHVRIFIRHGPTVRCFLQFPHRVEARPDIRHRRIGARCVWRTGDPDRRHPSLIGNTLDLWNLR